MSSSSYVLGVDLGGTKVAAAVFDMHHRRLTDVQILPTMARQPAKLTLLNLRRVMSQARKFAGVKGPPAAVGMGGPGPFDWKEGCLGADALPTLQGFPIKRFVEEEIGAPLYFENDANCFALGESLVGAGRDEEVVVGVTVGTGFGCGLVIGGRIQRGSTGNAGEVCFCRVAGGTFDEMLSGDGVRRFYQRVRRAAQSTVEGLDRPAGAPDAIAKDTPSAREIGELGEAGDPDAVEAWELFGRAIGEALGTIVAVVDPSVCVVGGSVARRFSLFAPALELTMKEFIAPEVAETIRIVASELGAAAGVTGAAEYAFQRMETE